MFSELSLHNSSADEEPEDFPDTSKKDHLLHILTEKKKKRFESQKAAQTLQCHSWLLLGQYISVQFPFLGHCMN